MKTKTILMICFCLSIGMQPSVGGEQTPSDAGTQQTTLASDSLLTPYDPQRDHLWNRLHRLLFVRTDAAGKPRVHSTDPLLYRGGTFLLEGDIHRRAVALLDEFLAAPDDRSIRSPLKRLVLQRDLWAAFDYVAWYPDDWVHHSRHEAAAIALRTRLARAVNKLSLTDRELDALPDNYAQAVTSREFPVDHDPDHPQRPFLPPDLFDPAGPWVRFHDQGGAAMTQKHFRGAGGRAVHITFLRLPNGRAATERYLMGLGSESVRQFPEGSMAAMVRRGLAVDQSAKVRVTPITELVQIRVYRRIPKDRRANFHGDFGEQDVYEFVLDRSKLFAGKNGLRPVGPNEPAQSFFRHEGFNPFDPQNRSPVTGPAKTQLKSCIHCHQAPGVYSVTSMRRGLQANGDDNFRTYDWPVEMDYTVRTKTQQYDWGLLQGMLEASRAARNAEDLTPH